MQNKPNYTKYYVPNDIAQQVRMVARLELHKETDEDCEVNKKVWVPQIRHAIAGRVLATLVEEEKKKLLK